MKTAIKDASLTLLISFLPVAFASAQRTTGQPSADEVVARMMEFDGQRAAALTGYTASRYYVAVNKSRRAEMAVLVTCDSDGAKQFSIVWEEGSSSIRKYVFHKLLKEEAEASRRGTRGSTRLTPTNYEFAMIGEEVLGTGPAYVLAVTPKIATKYMIEGKIWVNSNDYSIVRIEGQPARNPSFWVRNVHFVHTYEKVGQFWFAQSTHTRSEVRIFGPSELTIENSEYVLNRHKDRSGVKEQEARLVP